MKKLLPWIVGLFVLFFIVSAPTAAAGTVGNVAAMIGDWAGSLVTFLSALSSG